MANGLISVANGGVAAARRFTECAHLTGLSASGTVGDRRPTVPSHDSARCACGMAGRLRRRPRRAGGGAPGHLRPPPAVEPARGHHGPAGAVRPGLRGRPALPGAVTDAGLRHRGHPRRAPLPRRRVRRARPAAPRLRRRDEPGTGRAARPGAQRPAGQGRLRRHRRAGDARRARRSPAPARAALRGVAVDPRAAGDHDPRGLGAARALAQPPDQRACPVHDLRAAGRRGDRGAGAPVDVADAARPVDGVRRRPGAARVADGHHGQPRRPQRLLRRQLGLRTRPVRLAAADPFGHRRGAPVHDRLVAAPARPRRVHRSATPATSPAASTGSSPASRSGSTARTDRSPATSPPSRASS